jgi:flagellar protein FlaG
MAGNVTSVAAAIARTASPTVQTVFAPNERAPAAREALVAGNIGSSGGQSLPVGEAPKAQKIDLQQIAERLNQFVSDNARSLRFRVDDSSGRTVMTVVNGITNEVIRQVPAEETLALARTISELGGQLVDISV